MADVTPEPSGEVGRCERCRLIGLHPDTWVAEALALTERLNESNLRYQGAASNAARYAEALRAVTDPDGCSAEVLADARRLVSAP